MIITPTRRVIEEKKTTAMFSRLSPRDAWEIYKTLHATCWSWKQILSRTSFFLAWATRLPKGSRPKRAHESYGSRMQHVFQASNGIAGQELRFRWRLEPIKSLWRGGNWKKVMKLDLVCTHPHLPNSCLLSLYLKGHVWFMIKNNFTLQLILELTSCN